MFQNFVPDFFCSSLCGHEQTNFERFAWKLERNKKVRQPFPFKSTVLCCHFVLSERKMRREQNKSGSDPPFQLPYLSWDTGLLWCGLTFLASALTTAMEHNNCFTLRPALTLLEAPAFALRLLRDNFQPWNPIPARETFPSVWIAEWQEDCAEVLCVCLDTESERLMATRCAWRIPWWPVQKMHPHIRRTPFLAIMFMYKIWIP